MKSKNKTNLKTVKNHLFIIHHWLDNENIVFNDFVGENYSINGTIYGIDYIFLKSIYFKKVNLNEKLYLDKDKQREKEISFECYICNRDKTYGINKTIYLFTFSNNDISDVLQRIHRSNIDKIIKSINFILLNGNKNKLNFSLKNTSSVMYIEPNSDFNIAKRHNKKEITDFIMNFRKVLKADNVYNPFVFSDIVVDNNVLLVNSINSYITLGLGENKSYANKSLVPSKLVDFINVISMIDLVNRFNNKIINFDIFKYSISNYIDKANSSINLTEFYKSVYLREKQLSSSSRIIFASKIKQIENDFKNNYQELTTYNNIEDDIKIESNIKVSTKKTFIDNYSTSFSSIKQNIDLLETKENILNNAFRDLTTITTNELNLMLQQKIKLLTIIAIIITVLSTVLSLFKPFFTNPINNPKPKIEKVKDLENKTNVIQKNNTAEIDTVQIFRNNDTIRSR